MLTGIAVRSLIGKPKLTPQSGVANVLLVISVNVVDLFCRVAEYLSDFGDHRFGFLGLVTLSTRLIASVLRGINVFAQRVFEFNERLGYLLRPSELVTHWIFLNMADGAATPERKYNIRVLGLANADSRILTFWETLLN